jgi:hypothetical protein
MDGRRNFIKSLGLLSLAPFIKSGKEKKQREIFLFDFYIAGFKYYEGLRLIDNLKVNQTLILVQKQTNKYDNQAIEIYTEDEFKLGYVPAESNIVPFNLFKKDITIKCFIKEIDIQADTWEMVFCGLNQII